MFAPLRPEEQETLRRLSTRLLATPGPIASANLAGTDRDPGADVRTSGWNGPDAPTIPRRSVRFDAKRIWHIAVGLPGKGQRIRCNLDTVIGEPAQRGMIRDAPQSRVRLRRGRERLGDSQVKQNVTTPEPGTAAFRQLLRLRNFFKSEGIA
jgi:hypothetical protein